MLKLSHVSATPAMDEIELSMNNSNGIGMSIMVTQKNDEPYGETDKMSASTYEINDKGYYKKLIHETPDVDLGDNRSGERFMSSLSSTLHGDSVAMKDADPDYHKESYNDWLDGSDTTGDLADDYMSEQVDEFKTMPKNHDAIINNSMNTLMETLPKESMGDLLGSLIRGSC